MIVAGIDYSITCPCMCIHNQFFYFTKIKKYQLNTSIFKGFEYPDTKDDQEKFDIISEKFLEIIEEYGVSVVYLEGYAFASKGLVFNIGENTGLLKHKLYKADIPIITPSPGQIKKFATGKGNASKEMMYEAFLKKSSIDLDSPGFTPYKNPSSDIVDSYFIKEYGLLDI